MDLRNIKLLDNTDVDVQLHTLECVDLIFEIYDSVEFSVLTAYIAGSHT